MGVLDERQEGWTQNGKRWENAAESQRGLHFFPQVHTSLELSEPPAGDRSFESVSNNGIAKKYTGK